MPLHFLYLALETDNFNESGLVLKMVIAWRYYGIYKNMQFSVI